MTRHTSRRALLKGAAVLTAIPATALGGVPVFDVVEEAGPDPSTLEGRIITAAQWLDLAPPAIIYDPDDPGAVLFTDDLVDWMRATGRPAMNWMLSGDPQGYTREAMLADRKTWLEEQEFLRSISHLDKTELGLLLDAMEAAVRGEVPLEVGLAECKRAMQAHRAALAA